MDRAALARGTGACLFLDDTVAEGRAVDINAEPQHLLWPWLVRSPRQLNGARRGVRVSDP
jgi:hypothetical protein